MSIMRKILLFLLVPVVVVAAFAVAYIVRTYDASTQTEQASDIASDTDAETEASAETDVDAETESGADAESDTNADPDAETETDANSETNTDAETNAVAEHVEHPSQPENTALVEAQNDNTAKPMVALTFDDGPRKTYTEQILDILQTHDVVATFFLIGRQVESNSDTVARAYRMGNEIGNHSWSHVYLTRRSSDGIRSQISSTNDVIEAITGEAPKLMRPPYGDFNSSVANVIAEFEMPAIFWSVDPSDYRDITPDTIFDRVMGAVHDGAVILLHDTQERTVEATAKLIPALLDEGYQLVTVSELFQRKGVEPVPGQAYNNRTFTTPPFHGDE